MLSRLKNNSFKSKVTSYGALALLVLFAHPFDLGRELNRDLQIKKASREVFDNDGNLLRFTLSDDQQYRNWVSLNEVPQTIVDVFLYREDRYFNFHPGINPVSLMRSTFQYIFKGRPDSGASTLSMQLARLLSKRETKSLLGKGVQILNALALEVLYSKSTILEAYLNFTPYGRNIQGIDAASRIYFNKELHDLSLFEVSLLASLPQNPSLLNKHTSSAKVPEKLRKSATRLLTSVVDDLDGYRNFNIDSIKHTYTLKAINDTPFRAAHFTDFLLKKSSSKAIKSSLKLEIQESFEEAIKSYVELNKKKGFHNAAALLLNYKTMKVEAMVGSADFHNNTIQGQVNGTLAQRSPGSTLKPFIYGLALERGLISPESLLFDAPLAFRTPENFDNEYKGPLSSTESLITSRNVPAVYLASRLKDPNFFQFLKNLYPGKFGKTNEYGSSLALGAKEFSMLELVRLYSILANKGKFHGVRFLKDSEFISGPRVMKQQSVALLMQMLAKFDRPGLSSHYSSLVKKFPVYWKTGTSFGFRDAWSVGIFGPYVLAVWLGDFSGAGNPNLIGAQAAGPLFFLLVDRAKEFLPDYIHDTHQYHEDLREVEVCALSGLRRHKHCPHRKRGMIWPGVSSIKKCNIHRRIKIDRLSGLRSCLELQKTYDYKVMEIWPSHILEVFKNGGLARKSPPRLHPLCRRGHRDSQGFPPEIITPHHGVEYTYIEKGRGRTEKNQVIFKATGDGATHRLHWFINERYLGATKKNEPLIWLSKPGKYKVRVLDDYGRGDTRNLSVKYL